MYLFFFLGVDFREKTLEIDSEIFKVCLQRKIYIQELIIFCFLLQLQIWDTAGQGEFVNMKDIRKFIYFVCSYN
jgi:hypothetical protein